MGRKLNVDNENEIWPSGVVVIVAMASADVVVCGGCFLAKQLLQCSLELLPAAVRPPRAKDKR
jgi:hypothetical protein